jgi:hypothetical protein
MALVPQQVQWGTLTITLDTQPFEHAYTMGREHYFDTWYEDSHSVHTMTVPQVMRLVAIPDDKGSYQFDDDPNNAEAILGFTLGYMSGAVLPETAEEREQRLHRYERHVKHLPESVAHVA